MSNTLKVSILFAFCLSSSACLKTRAQLKEENSDEVPAHAAASVETPAASATALDELKQELNRLNNRVVDLERSQAQNSREGAPASKDEMKKLLTRVEELEQAQLMMLETLKKNQTAAAGPAADPTEVFRRGKTLFSADDYEGAIENLSRYIQSAPKGAHIEEATFLRAESYFKTKQYKKAIVDYGRFPEKYTKSRRMPSALYQLGRSFELLGMKDEARAFFQELSEKYPKSPEAKRSQGSGSKLK